MSDQTQHAPDQQPPRRPRTVHKQHSVMLYIVILFLAACLLILLSYLMQRRNNDQMLDGLNQSVSAMQSVAALQEENAALKDELAAAESALADRATDIQTLERERSALLQTAEALEQQVQAMDWFWQIDEAYVRGRYSLCRELMENLEAAGLAGCLPRESITENGRFSPADRYAEIYEKLY